MLELQAWNPNLTRSLPLLCLIGKEWAVLHRWGFYWNLSAMSTLGSEIRGKSGKEFTSGLHLWGCRAPLWLWESWRGWHTLSGCLWAAGVAWLPRFHPGVWVFSKQKASVLLIQQPKQTDVHCVTRDHLIVMSKWLGGQEKTVFPRGKQAGIPGPLSGA